MFPINIMGSNFLSDIIFYFRLRYSFHPFHVQEDYFFSNTVLDNLWFCQLQSKFSRNTKSINFAVSFSFSLNFFKFFINKLNGLTDFIQLPSVFLLGVFGRGRKFLEFINFLLQVFFKQSYRTFTQPGNCC